MARLAKTLQIEEKHCDLRCGAYPYLRSIRTRHSIIMASDDVEHTLFVCRQVNLYRVPPKATAGGHKSGEWKVADKIFTGRLKVTARGDAAEVRLEDSDR